MPADPVPTTALILEPSYCAQGALPLPAVAYEPVEVAEGAEVVMLTVEPVYNSSQRCGALFTATPGWVLQLSVLSMSLESGHDFLYVRRTSCGVAC